MSQKTPQGKFLDWDTVQQRAVNDLPSVQKIISPVSSAQIATVSPLPSSTPSRSALQYCTAYNSPQGPVCFGGPEHNGLHHCSFCHRPNHSWMNCFQRGAPRSMSWKLVKFALEILFWWLERCFGTFCR